MQPHAPQKHAVLRAGYHQKEEGGKCGLEIDVRIVSFRLGDGVRYSILHSFQCRTRFLVGDFLAMRISNRTEPDEPSFSSWLAGRHCEQRLGDQRAHRFFSSVHRASSQRSSHDELHAAAQFAALDDGLCRSDRWHCFRRYH